MVGTNTDEHRLFLATGGAIAQVTAEDPGRSCDGLRAPGRSDAGRLSRAHRGASAGDLLAAIQTDWYGASRRSVWPTRMRRAPRPPICTSLPGAHRSLADWFGACHALEIPFVFDNLGAGTEGLLGDDPPQRLADTMHAAWVDFAAKGDCGWPKYDLCVQSDQQFRSNVGGRGRSSICRAGAVGRRALAYVSLRLRV